MLAAITNLHHAHHIGIGKGTYDECYERGSGNAGSKTEDGMETGIVRPIGSGWNPVADGAQSYKEEVHGEACPDEKAGFLIAPYFAHYIVDDVTYRKHDETASQRNRAYCNLLCFEHVCCNETNAEEDAEKHKQHTHFFSIFLFFTRFTKHSDYTYFLIRAAKLQLFSLTAKYLLKFFK